MHTLTVYQWLLVLIIVVLMAIALSFKRKPPREPGDHE